LATRSLESRKPTMIVGTACVIAKPFLIFERKLCNTPRRGGYGLCQITSTFLFSNIVLRVGVRWYVHLHCANGMIVQFECLTSVP
jgi:hypothetical protein